MADNKKDDRKGAAARGDAKDGAKGNARDGGDAKDSARDGAEFKPVDLREVKALLRQIDDKLGGASLLGDAPRAPYRPAERKPDEALRQEDDYLSKDWAKRAKRWMDYGEPASPLEWGSPDDPSVLNDYDD